MIERRSFLKKAAATVVGAAVGSGGVGTAASAPQSGRSGSTTALRTAARADDVAQASGCNVRYNDANPDRHTYANEVHVTDRVLDVGYRIVRNKLANSGASQDQQRYAFVRLAGQGVRMQVRLGDRQDADTLSAARATVNAVLDEMEWYGRGVFTAIEGANEPNNDNVARSIWAPQTRRLQQAIWEESRRSSRPLWIQRLDVVGPSMARPIGDPDANMDADYAALGDISQWVTMGNLHIYPLGMAPSTDAKRFKDLARQSYPGISRWAVTEGGYWDAGLGTPTGALGYAGSSNPTPADVADEYAVKHVFEHLLRGNERFCKFEFLNDTMPSSWAGFTQAEKNERIREGTFGDMYTPSLDPATWSPKPIYHARKRLLALYDERDPVTATVPVYDPQPLNVDISPPPSAPDGTGSEIRSHLAQRANGKWLLAIWRDVDLGNWDPSTNTWTAYDVPAISITVTLGSARRVAIYKPSVQYTPTNTLDSTSSFVVHVAGGLGVAVIG